MCDYVLNVIPTLTVKLGMHDIIGISTLADILVVPKSSKNPISPKYWYNVKVYHQV